MEIQELRILSSIPINSIDKNENIPVAMGSGCFVRYKGCLIFITVLHTVEVEKNINHGILVDYITQQGTCLCEIEDFSICVMGNILTNKLESVDFALKRFTQPMPPCKYLINRNSTGEFDRLDRVPLSSNLDILPSLGEEYGFSGLVQGSLSRNPTYMTLNAKLVYYDKVRYLESKGSCHTFSLDNKNYSHEDFEGTSGAPIIDSKGNLVSLVMGGKKNPDDPNQWLLYGVNLSKFSVMADINCDLI